MTTATPRRTRAPNPQDFRLDLPAHPTEYGETRPPMAVYGAKPKDGITSTTGLLLVSLGFANPPENLFFVKMRRMLATRYNLVVLGVAYMGTAAKRTRRMSTTANVDGLRARVAGRFGRAGVQKCEGPDGFDLKAACTLLRGEDLSDVIHMTEAFGQQDATDYLDFCFVAAMDLVWAVQGVLREAPLLDRGRIHLVGSSMGGVVVQQALRFAPHTFASVLDISGKVLVEDGYTIRGRQRKVLLDSWNTRVKITNASVYQDHDPRGPFFYTEPMRQVRQHTRPLEPFDGARPYVHMVTGSDDTLVSLPAKETQRDNLEAAGAEVVVTRVTPDDVDGTVIKHAGHAFGAEFSKLIPRFAGPALELRRSDAVNDFDRGSVVRVSDHWTVRYDEVSPRLWPNR